MKKNILIAVVLVAILVLGAIVIGSESDDTDKSMQNMDMSRTDSSSSDSQQSEPVAANTVIIDSLDFQQKEITVKKGDTVTWKNEDTARHNVVFDDESIGEVENNKLIGQGQELKFTFDKTGEFGYSCSPHSFMKATVIVTE